LPPQAGERHTGKFVEHDFCPGQRDVIIDPFALIRIPSEETDSAAAAA
jgi:hypothetical protein